MQEEFIRIQLRLGRLEEARHLRRDLARRAQTAVTVPEVGIPVPIVTPPVTVPVNTPSITVPAALVITPPPPVPVITVPVVSTPVVATPVITAPFEETERQKREKLAAATLK